MRMYDILRDAEAEADAAGFLVAGFFDAVERLEDAFALILGDAGAVVVDGDFGGVLRFRCLEPDLRRELTGV